MRILVPFKYILFTSLYFGFSADFFLISGQLEWTTHDVSLSLESRWALILLESVLEKQKHLITSHSQPML